MKNTPKKSLELRALALVITLVMLFNFIPMTVLADEIIAQNDVVVTDGDPDIEVGDPADPDIEVGDPADPDIEGGDNLGGEGGDGTLDEPETDGDEVIDYSNPIDVSSSDELMAALAEGAFAIRIVADFELDRTFYVTSDAIIIADESHTLTRASGFGGDIFVVGENELGEQTETPVVLTIGKPDEASASMIVIDGNSENMTVDVVGSVFFIREASRADLYHNLTVKNNVKVGNEKTLNEIYKLSYPVRIGGAVAIVSYKASMRIYGGLYEDNRTNDITDSNTDEGARSSHGGAFYNYGTMDIYGGTFDSNHAGRGGAFYNYRTMNIYSAVISNNTSSTLGGAIYVPASNAAYLYIGEDNEIVESSVIFEDNVAESNGGAIYAQHVATIKNTQFINNVSTSEKGGAISANSIELSVENSRFEGNSAPDGYGGAIYITGNNGEEDSHELTVSSTDFIGNSSTRGGVVYASEDARLYFASVKFEENHSSGYAGVIYATKAFVEINGAQINRNSSKSSGGVIYIIGTADSLGSASVVMNNVTADSNTASSAGIVYAKQGATITLYNSTLSNNSVTGNGGALYADEGSALASYNTVFKGNVCGSNGAAIMLYTNGTQSIIHSCSFEGNETTGTGGGIYISNKSLLDMYNVTATDNSALKGGFMYETTTGTVVKLAGLTLSGNTASEGGPIIWGNSTGAKLYIDKIKYVDKDYNGDWDDAYWASAIFNSLKVYNESMTIPSYVDYSGETVEPPVADSITNVNTSAQLERALEVGYTLIRITSDFEIDRTFYVKSSVTIFADESHTLTRASDFGGDVFVVGEDADGNAVEGVVLTLTSADGTDAPLTIDGNSENMTTDVVGTVIFVCDDATANLGKNLTVTNHTKVGNDRVLSGHTVSYPVRTGGAVAIICGGASMNIYGGVYSDNRTNDITDASTDEGSVCSYGGAFYNYGKLNIYGGSFVGNHAGRGGAFYNYRTMHIYSASIVGNTASAYGGAIYTPNSTSAFLYVGEENETVEDAEVLFTDNSATSGGGAVYLNNLASIKNAVFEGNSASDGNGGAIHASKTRMTLEDVELIDNTSSKYGGAIYLSGNNGLEDTIELNVINSVFDGNTATSRAGAIYMSGGARAYFEGTEIKNNSSAAGGAFYLNGASTEFNSCAISKNSSTGNGGAFVAVSAAAILINDTEISENSGAHGGVAHLTESELSVYNSTFIENASAKNGAAVYAYTGAVLNAYNTVFESNRGSEIGGALYIYTAGTQSIIHSCSFEGNTAGNSGGGLYISNKSLVDMYNITAKNNSAPKGGFMYETTSGTVVDLVGLTVSGNAATDGGAIIWGNTTNAKLNIDKSKYTDLDATGELGDEYWASAIYNKLTVAEIEENIPKYLDYGNEPYDELSDAVDVKSADELEAAINSGVERIRIVEDFEIDRTFYITGNVTIFSTIKRTLTRASDFGGDFFVVGENEDGESALLMGANASLTLGNPYSIQKNLLVFDGNKENMKVETVGSVLFISYSSTVNLYENVTVRDFHKTGNERTLNEKYFLSIENRVGGALAVVESGTLNVHGGYYANNTINNEGDTSLGEAERISTVGGLIFNASNVNIYGGTFEGNVGARGGVIYNYRVVRIFGGSFIGNHAYIYGGVYYAPNSAQSHLYIGTADGEYGEVEFRENSSENSGGVIYASTLSANVIYGHADFTGNYVVSSGSGGAICMYGQLTVRDTTFNANIAKNRGGAIYASNSSAESVTRFVEITGCSFTDNSATLGGALSLYASGADYPEGAIATVTECEFTGNKASSEVNGASAASGGAIYADRKVSLTVKESSFSSNTASTEGGAVYIAGMSDASFTDCTMSSNSSDKFGGAICLRSAYLTIDGTEIKGSSAKNNGGAIYVSYQSNIDINSKLTITDSLIESSATEANGGAIYATRRSALEDEWNILTIKNSTFKSNSAKNGGALYTLAKVGAYLENVSFVENTAAIDESSEGGAWFATGSIAEINGASFESNSATYIGGAFKLDNDAIVTMSGVNASKNSASLGGFAHSSSSVLNIYDSNISENRGEKSGGAIYAHTGTSLNAYNTVFEGNTCVENGGALMIYTDAYQSLLHSCTFESNLADGVGGAMYVSNKSLVDMYNITAKNNGAQKGGFMYETTTGSTVKLVGITLSGNTATEGGSIIWGNSTGAILNIDKSKYTDIDATGELGDEYWASAIYNKLTVAEIEESVPSYEEYDHYEPTAPSKKPKPAVSVDDVFNIAKNSSDGYISSVYESLPILDKSSNFLSDGVTRFENINGTTVTVDNFVYAAYAKDGIASASEGILIYQAMLYKQAHPEEDVSIAISAYRFSVEAAVNINRDSKYFGYMRNLGKAEYDEFGFVRIAYLLVSAAKMGINVTVIGQLDAYPVTWGAENFYDYFTNRLDTPCDERYATGVVDDYMDFNFCYWSLDQKGGTDMMHTKLCAVSHYIDVDGVEHRNAVWTSSSNLDGIHSKGYNANWKLQTATIISDHEYIYRVSANYLRLISEYCGQEQIYEFQDIMSREGARQIELILAGRGDEILPDEQLVYLGTENDSVFELYFTPFAGSTIVWDEQNNPYCKYIRELYNSEDSIIFVWNAAEYNSQFSLGQQMEDLIVGAFYNNKNVENKFYGMMENFDGTKLSGLKVGRDIGVKHLNQFHHNRVHNKDILMSYVKDGQRYYVSLLNSCNMHSGSMCYQSNFMLVIKESEWSEDSVFFTMANLSTKDIVDHTYGEEQAMLPEGDEHGYYYIPCVYCDKMIITGTIHCPGEWIIDKEVTLESNGIQHKECKVCGSIVEMREVTIGEADELENSDIANSGISFSQSGKIKTDVEETPLTIEAFIKLPNSHDKRGGVIVSNYDELNGNVISLEIYERGKVRLYTRKNGIKHECFFEPDIRSDQPVHIAVTVDGNAASLYVNGTLADTQTLKGGMPNISSALYIGGDTRYQNSQYFKGEIYSVAMFSDIRTATEIAKDMFTIADDEQELIYSRSYASSLGTIENSGVTFDSTTTSMLNELEKTPLSIEAIISLPKNYSKQGGVIVGNYGSNQENQLSFEIHENGVPVLYINRAGSVENVMFDADVRKGAPVHLALVIDETTALLYVNGELADTKELSEAIPEITSEFSIGSDKREGNTQYFKGVIYAVGLYGKAKSAEQIASDSVIMNSEDESILYLNYYTTTSASESSQEGKTFSEDSFVTVENLTNSPHTIEATILVLPEMHYRSGVIIGNYDNGTGKQINLEIYYGGVVRLFYNTGSTKQSCIFSQTSICSFSKRHIAVTVEGKTAKLYVDGVLRETRKLKAELPNATEGFRVGGDNRFGNDQYFKGQIYSVAMFSDARSAEQIQSDMEFIPKNADSLIYLRDFTKTSVDSGSRPQSRTYTSSKLNKIGNLSSAPYTMEAVIRVPTTMNDRAGVIFGNYHSGGPSTQMTLEVHENGRIRLFFVNNAKRVDTIFKTDIRSDTPVHIAVTVDGKVATLYLNGKAVESATLALGLPEITKNFVIGGDNRRENSQYFKGEIYSLALFSDVRTAEEIRADSVCLPYGVDSLIYSKSYGDSYCNPYSLEKEHLESDWIVDREATDELNGIKHKECMSCGKIIAFKEILPSHNGITGSYKDIFTVDLSENAGLSPKSEADALSTDVLASSPKTFEAIIQLDYSYSSRAGVVIGSYDGGNGDGINMEIYTTGNPRLYYKVGRVGYSYVFKTDVRSDALTHVAITIEGLVAKLYVNGEFAEEVTLSTEAPDVIDSFYIGNDARPASGQYFKGKIYGVAMFDDVRTAEEIAEDAIIITSQAEGVLYSEYYTAK